MTTHADVMGRATACPEVVPVALGGTNDPWNLVAACWDCNSGKTSGHPTDELIERVRHDCCWYVSATDALEVVPCAYCGLPMVREFEDEDPLDESGGCQRCTEIFHLGYRYGMRATD